MVVPAAADDGDTAMDGVTVNVVGGDDHAPAVKTTACGPGVLAAVPDGTENWALVNPPAPSVLAGPETVTAVPAKVAESTALAGKPVPETVTTEPTGPWLETGDVTEIDDWAAPMTLAPFDVVAENAA